MPGFEDDPDPKVRALVERARKRGWFDQEAAAASPILKETWDEGGWPVTTITFGLEHMLAAGFHPRDFNTTPEERLEQSIVRTEEEAWESLLKITARPEHTKTNRIAPRPHGLPLGSPERIAAEILDLAVVVRSLIVDPQSAGCLAENTQKLEQKRIALRDLVRPHPKDGAGRRPTVEMIDGAAAQSAAPRKRKPNWLKENEEKIGEMLKRGKSAWHVADVIARQYKKDRKSIYDQLKKRILAGEFPAMTQNS